MSLKEVQRLMKLDAKGACTELKTRHECGKPTNHQMTIEVSKDE
jgi:hypothetical protein